MKSPKLNLVPNTIALDRLPKAAGRGREGARGDFWLPNLLTIDARSNGVALVAGSESTTGFRWVKFPVVRRHLGSYIFLPSVQFELKSMGACWF